MRYFVKSDDNGIFKAVGIGNGGVEITKEEYDTLLTEIREKAALVDQLYSCEITIEDVPTEWQEEIRRRVNERIAAEGAAEEQEISGDEFMTMLEGAL